MNNSIKIIDTDDNRPDPDVLLAAVNAEERRSKKGKLKIFLGATPGVGKTYAMLEAAHNEQANKVKIVVGIIVTHGRLETEKLLDNLPMFPTKKIKYKEKTFFELDTERIIKEKPQLVLVDELAHINTIGSINKRRYQDIMNLLDAGIDVYTTVNVQHLESLKDEIYQITKVRVKATVPDYIFELAHETVVIDLTPDELTERLNQGKVYVPEEAKRALNNYFSKNNISALRTLALQVAAKSISKSVLNYKQTHGIHEPWSIREKTLVCLSDSSFTPSLIRSAKRISTRNNAELVAIYIDTPLRTLTPKSKKRISNYKRYAEYLGAETITLTSVNVAKCILKYANENNITHIVLSKAVHSRFAEFVIGSVVNEIIRSSGSINVHVLSERPKVDTSSITKQLINKFFYSKKSNENTKFILLDLILVCIVSIIAFQLKRLQAIDNVSTVFLLLSGVVFTAYKHGFLASMITSIACCAVFTVFFEEPYFYFTIEKITGVVALVIFLILSYMISRLTYVLKEQLRKSTNREKVITVLYNYSKQMADITKLEDLYTAATNNIFSLLERQTVIYMPINGKLKQVASDPKIEKLRIKADAALDWTWANGQVSGGGTDTLSSSLWFFSPLKVSDKKIGVIGIKIEGDRSLFEPDMYDVFQSLTDLTAVAISRLQFAVGN
jgi:two-component system, OmpR family, sensor histidine kinase KdpD